MTNSNAPMKVEPIYIRKLVDKTSTSKAAVMIGVSSAAISAMLRDGVVRPVNEIAAKLIYHDTYLGLNRVEDKIAVVKANDNAMETIKQIATATGGSVKEI